MREDDNTFLEKAGYVPAGALRGGHLYMKKIRGARPGIMSLLVLPAPGGYQVEAKFVPEGDRSCFAGRLSGEATRAVYLLRDMGGITRLERVLQETAQFLVERK